MIVIASYNRIDYLSNLLQSINNTVDLDEQVLIVCTCPKELEFISLVKQLIDNSNYSFNISYTVTPYSGYDTGAYIWAYQNYHDEYYIFLHDTVYANDMNWFKVFKSFRDEMTLNTWCFFNLNDHPDHTKFFMEKINVRYSLNGALGVFGPMFQISNTALTLIDQKFDLTKFIPSNKMEAAAMERGWTYIANEIGLRLNTIDGHFSHNKDDYQHKLLTKYFANRI